MQSFAKDLSRVRIRRQSGSVATLGALWLMIAVICLATIDIGNVFWQKRELQKIADLAALAGAQGETPAACQANAARIATLNGMTGAPQVECGNWTPSPGVADTRTYFVNGASPLNASRVTVARTVPYLFLFSVTAANGRQVEAVATAARSRPLAQLRIRSTLLVIDDKQSAILNPIIGGLLGGNLNIQAVGWNGLSNAHVSLLDFFKELGGKKGLIDINATVIDYEKILDAPISALDVVNVMLTLFQRPISNGDSASAVNAAITALNAVIAANISNVQITLRQILNVSSGLPEAALQTQLNALNIIQLLAQVSGQKNGVAVKGNALDIPGVAGVKLNLKVIEPPQASVIAALPTTSASSYANAAVAVKTAQIQALISVDLKVLDGLSGLVNALGGLIGLLTSVSPQLTTLPTRFDVQVEGVGAQAWVENGQCLPTKRMRVHAETSVAKIRFGRFGNSADEAFTNAFSNNPSSYLQPFKIIDIGRQDLLSREAGYYGGIGLKLDSSEALKDSKIFDLSAPDSLLSLNSNNEAFQKFSMNGLISSLQGLLIKNKIEIIQPPSGNDVLAAVLDLVTKLVAEVLKTVSTVVAQILAPLLDPVLNQLLGLLGIDLAQAELEGRMDCGTVALVY
ncbi:TadG family pilus assembly protein [Comamonas thiooxydans]|uniref:TadG family pilus assembly protein n=1 Tax=Comamonas thiooxydans TaxID=363952 RepID=UPI00209C19F7|nr:TadG family pilus assembly protein [Comamonas thiooxydans]MCO8248223.1 pilus assembly protein TadG-related protein [Comamonas thiooxydans]